VLDYWNILQPELPGMRGLCTQVTSFLGQEALGVGLGLGAALALLLGNPLSGLTAAPEMLPAGWGQLGQLLPQGATATLLRSTAYFGGAGADLAIIVLSCWVLAGLTLVIIAALRRPGSSAPMMRRRGTR
ncbi:mycobacterial-type methylenetetrahydrofolate reductase, partial [Mycolicibacterium porcinum]|uniref:mycobacterial-type methylenetetrahydrofolate reductase n=1 Tax=Mycolicibacterium porcinum TaxID=39693 RepID=UPI00256F49DE